MGVFIIECNPVPFTIFLYSPIQLSHAFSKHTSGIMFPFPNSVHTDNLNPALQINLNMGRKRISPEMRKVSISISLPRELIEEFDKMLDGKSRSRVIEVLLVSALQAVSEK